MITTEDTEVTEKKYPYSEITDKIIRCAIEVHRTLGPGFTENIYEQALVYEMKQNGLDIKQQLTVPVSYKNIVAGEHRLDILVNNEIIVENKAVKDFEEIHTAQILSYLKASCKKVGLLINFAKTKVDIKRVIL